MRQCQRGVWILSILSHQTPHSPLPSHHNSPHVCSIDAESIDTVEEKLESLAHRLGFVLLMARQHPCAHDSPQRLSLCIARRRLDAPDDSHHPPNQCLEVVPLEGRIHRPCIDEIKVNDCVDVTHRPLSGNIADAVANLAKNADGAHVARRTELEVVREAVPKRLVERLADAAEGGVFDARPPFAVELE